MILIVPLWLALLSLMSHEAIAISQMRPGSISHGGESSLFLECGLQVGDAYFLARTLVDTTASKSILAFDIESIDAAMTLDAIHGIRKEKTYINVIIDGIIITAVALKKGKSVKQWNIDFSSVSMSLKENSINQKVKIIRHREVYMQCNGVRDTLSGEVWSDFPTALPKNSYWSLEQVDSHSGEVRNARSLQLVRRSLPPKRTRAPTRVPTKIKKVTKSPTLSTTRKPTSIPSQYPTRPPFFWVSETPMSLPTEQPYFVPLSQKPSSSNPMSAPMAVSVRPSSTLNPTTGNVYPVPYLHETLNPTLSKMPSKQETIPPSKEPSFTRTIVPTPPPMSKPTPIRSHYDAEFNLTVVLLSGARLSRGGVVLSPSGEFRFGLSNVGNLEVTRSKTLAVIWQANLTNASSCYMQPDGNLVVKRGDNLILWQSHTVRNPGAILVLDDGGQVSIVSQGTVIWLAGLPRGQYSGPSSEDMTFPVRGAFYYPWYPQTWRVNGKSVFYRPTLGQYSNSDYRTHAFHVDALTYAQVDVSIASWWGPNTQLERARLTDLLIQSRGKTLKWSIYHEMELHLDPTIDQIREDLNYLKAWYTWHEGWAHVDGRPLIFVYNEGDCNVAERWSKASNGEWYVVLKVFKDFQKCLFQPDHWHQYAPSNIRAHAIGYSYSISPGFWVADQDKPKLPRLNASDWRQSVAAMVNSKEDWQLITTFNEWGEGSAVESAEDWSSDSGYGFYLDALRDIK